jgi:plasmid stabilization system protein ParE
VPTKHVDLLEQAAAEYDAAFDWYLNRSLKAARDFDAEVTRAVAQILQSPQRWAAGSHQTRRCLLRKFPFVVIYRARSESLIQIVAFAHTSRKPGYWKSRTGS